MPSKGCLSPACSRGEHFSAGGVAAVWLFGIWGHLREQGVARPAARLKQGANALSWGAAPDRAGVGTPVRGGLPPALPSGNGGHHASGGREADPSFRTDGGCRECGGAVSPIL